ncbi:MAG: Rieske 2Fe-2S domain-containing protein [Gammaproteobacteria bacterium]|nr:Rieske 2Fe-2S domain-containing protein [Gammaproteobacteria bacterium]MCP5199627.1 Rieske 2Fe-2S domain-containing protein [Gammaproteobacteria bacterium]
MTSTSDIDTSAAARRHATQVPYRLFYDQDVYDAEQRHLFRGPTWNFVGLAAEVPEPGDFKASFVGDTPVVLTRDRDGALHCWVNRCAHRGALVCREPRGNRNAHRCVYHQWTYDPAGRLRGVPFRAGIDGKGGAPADFDLARHGLQTLAVATYGDLVFAAFDPAVEALDDYLGAPMRAALDGIFNRPLTVLGHTRQYAAANWKLYAENVRDPYHASLLHLFHATFGFYRSSQPGRIHMDPRRRHCVLESWPADAKAEAARLAAEDVTSYRAKYTLADPSLVTGRPEFRGLQILSVFPGLVVQQIQNTLAVRQLLPKGVGRFELVVTLFGYADDDPELTAIRLKQANLIGPAGFISMEDGHATEIVQRAIADRTAAESVVVMGGYDAADRDDLVNEAAIRGFWQHYRELLGERVGHAPGGDRG